MRKYIIILLAFSCAFFMFLPSVTAHELYIQVEEYENSGELRVDVLWGHIRDYVSEASPDEFELYVRYPEGTVKQLNLEEAGVYSRANVPITSDGTYTFWANREKGTYTPEEGTTQLSNHMAKVVHHVGNSSSHAVESVDMEFEIVPDVDLTDFSIGKFTGKILLYGSTISESTVTAYGPEHEILETTTDDNGRFSFTFESTGKWLIKANLIEEEAGSIQGESYEVISNTSTLLVDTTDKVDQEEHTNLWSLLAMLVVGLLLGTSLTLIMLRKRIR
ncbi:DUF4198 domain-containing protein [Ornithinibacillus salinisoli]|uniref:DUF4198 domain-containing protein n=1 Tax=Ornithinibacillus salinisoli TaxID=1848459 RepID=A0ABW4VYW5_9BACI